MFWGKINSKSDGGFKGRPVPQQVGSEASVAGAHCSRYLLCLTVSQLYSVYFLSFDSHSIYYLFKHRQIKCHKRIILLHKAVTHELSAHILFGFLFWERDQGMPHAGLGVPGFTGSRFSPGSSLWSVLSARLAGPAHSSRERAEGRPRLSSMRLSRLIYTNFWIVPWKHSKLLFFIPQTWK